MEWYRKTLEIDPSFDQAYVQRAEIHRLQGNYQAAAADLERIAPAAPQVFRVGSRAVLDASAGRRG